MDADFIKKYFAKQKLSLEGYTPISLNDVSDSNETEFCNMFSAWYTAKKGILLGRIIGEKLGPEQIPECYSNAILKAQEVARDGN